MQWNASAAPLVWHVRAAILCEVSLTTCSSNAVSAFKGAVLNARAQNARTFDAARLAYDRTLAYCKTGIIFNTPTSRAQFAGLHAAETGMA
eukprot:2092787-Pleurochrysis_carterae.AAC.2